MSGIDIVQDDSTILVQQDGLTVIETDDSQVDVIQTFDQGPPGITGPPGPQGIPGPEGVGEAPMDGRTYGRKVAEWVPFGGITSCEVGDTAPPNAPDNSLWFEADSGLLFIKYNDGNSSQWVVTPKVGGLVDAPADGNSYGRLNGDWARVAPLVSPAFTGAPRSPTPVAGSNDTTVATTAFVANAIATGGTGPGGSGGPTLASSVIVTPTGQVNSTDAQSAFTELDAEKVAKAGDTMTGALIVIPPTAGGHATTKTYVDGADAAAKTYTDSGNAATLTSAKGYTDSSSAATLTSAKSYADTGDSSTLTAAKSYTDSSIGGAASQVSSKVSKAGDTMTGALNLIAPTQPAHAATKAYVDGAATTLDNAKVNRTGDTMSGNLTAASFSSRNVYLNGTSNYLIFDGTNNVIRQGAAGTYFQKGDGSANLAWVDTNGSFTAVGNIAAYGALSTNAYVVVGGGGGGSIYLGTSYNYSIQCNSVGKFTISCSSCTFSGGSVTSNGSGAFTPTNVDAASFIGWGAYGGALTLQDGGNRAAIWTSAGNMAFATGGNPPTVRLQLSNDGNNVIVGTLNINGPLLNIYGNNFYLLNSLCITRTAPFTTLCDDQGNQRIILGNNNSASTYHRQVFHNFQVPSGNQYFGVDPGGVHLAVGDAYKAGGGPWADSSDERIKRVLGKYKHGLDQILALNPVRFVYKGNDTTELPSGAQAPFTNSAHRAAATTGKEFIGLIAQEAEGPMPEMVSTQQAYLDGVRVDDLRMLDPSPLVFALINAVKELTALNEIAMRRIDTLEKKLGATHV
jgi:hypothetical protein